MAEDDYTDDRYSSSSAPKEKGGTLFGLPYWEVLLIGVAGVFIAIYLKDHILGGGSSSPTYTISPNGTSPAVTSSGGATQSSGSSSTSTPGSAIATWIQDANNFATSIGMNQSTVNSALENYTAGNKITNGAQATAINSIVNSLGSAPGLGAPQVDIQSTQPKKTTSVTPATTTAVAPTTSVPQTSTPTVTTTTAPSYYHLPSLTGLKAGTTIYGYDSRTGQHVALGTYDGSGTFVSGLASASTRASEGIGPALYVLQ